MDGFEPRRSGYQPDAFTFTSVKMFGKLKLNKPDNILQHYSL